MAQTLGLRLGGPVQGKGLERRYWIELDGRGAADPWVPSSPWIRVGAARGEEEPLLFSSRDALHGWSSSRNCIASRREVLEMQVRCLELLKVRNIGHARWGEHLVFREGEGWAFSRGQQHPTLRLP